MAVVRTPISLKFDDDSDAFYKDFITPLKESKQLTACILDLLKLCYENETVRDELEAYREQNNPFALIQKQINRMATQHQKTMMSTGVLGDVLKNAKDNLGQNVEADASEYTSKETHVSSELERKVSDLESLVPKIDEKVDKVLRLVESVIQSDKNMGVAQPTVTAVQPQIGFEAQPVVVPQYTQAVVSEHATFNTEATQTSEQYIQPQPPVEVRFTKPDNSENITPKQTESVILFDDDDEGVKNTTNEATNSSVATGVAVKQPTVGSEVAKKSFGKLMGSLKK